MQDLSFVFRNASFKVRELHLEIMIYTFSNAYSLDPVHTEVLDKGTDRIVRCTQLLTNGGQLAARGGATILVHVGENRMTVEASARVAESTEEIRCLKVILKDLEAGDVINLIDATPRRIPAKGICLRYPEGWRDVGTPLVILSQKGDRYLYFRSRDDRVRRKSFVFFRQEEGLCAELIFEEEATEMKNSIQVPAWEIGDTASVDQILTEHQEHVQNAYHLLSWEERPDVPAWAREISLVAAIHGQHWTGYIFNDYAAILENIERLCEKIEPKRILAYLPGWEGRYYWKYGNYSPDERMGGEKGFRALCEKADRLGVHLMPMFGINVTGIHYDGYAAWGAPCVMHTASGNAGGGSVDWDGSRHYDHSSNSGLNPAAPKWQNRLVQQITSLVEEYGFHGVFLDIAACWSNDPNHSVYQGVRKLAGRLRENHPEILLSGEGWYDALAACIPLLQCGHTDGRMHWHDESYGSLFDTYTREFAHLCLGDPSRYSTGVHEQGTNPEWRAPIRKGIIPTVTIVDGTMEKAPEKVDLIMEDAKEYARRYL